MKDYLPWIAAIVLSLCVTFLVYFGKLPADAMMAVFAIFVHSPSQMTQSDVTNAVVKVLSTVNPAPIAVVASQEKPETK